MFSGEVANTQEHVVPAWVQSRYGLSNLTLILPNGTDLKYRHAKVPALDVHNKEFGKIESRIATDKLILSELYLWALKLHCGLLYRDSLLKLDRRQPDSPPILDLRHFSAHLSLFRRLYTIWRSGGNTSPEPLGSVFVVESGAPEDEFDLMHNLHTGTLAVNLGRCLIVVHLFDQSDGLNSTAVEQWEAQHLSAISAEQDPARRRTVAYMARHVWVAESAYWLFRHRRSFNAFYVGNGLGLVPPLTRLPPQQHQRKEFAKVCSAFGLRIVEHAGEYGNKYALAQVPGST